MATAKIEREMFARGEGILAKAADDEPIFIMRGQDILAADSVFEWSVRANLLGCQWDRVREAKELAQQMREWPIRKNPD